LDKERAMIFVDHANVFKNLEKFKGRIDWEKFKYVLAQDSYLVGALIYVGMAKKVSINKRRYLRSLEIVKYVIQPKPV